MTCTICNKSMMARAFKTHKSWHLNQLRKELCEMCGKIYSKKKIYLFQKHFLPL